MNTEKRGVIFDIDGVLEYQGNVYPGAVEIFNTLKRNGFVIRVLTNSTLKSRSSCAVRLQKQGFDVIDEEIVTASYATAKYLEYVKPRSCWVMLEREGIDEFKNITHDQEDPEYIVIGDNRTQFNFYTLNKVLRLLINGSKLIGMIPERIDTSMGEVELNVGSWVEMLAQASKVHPTYIGKPSSIIFDLTVKTMKLEKKEIIMVGDRIGTDIKGAHEYGIQSILVQTRTGECDEREFSADIKPDYTIHSINELKTIL